VQNRFCRLYLISPPKFDLSAFATQLEEAVFALKSGAFQLRLKDASDANIIAAIKTLLPICHAAGVAFIINDRPDLCAEYDCDGVHVGQEDLLSYRRTPVSSKNKELDTDFHRDDVIGSIRQTIGNDRILGVTCHASKHLAMEAGEAGVDYVAFGAFYDTTSKPKEKLEKWGTPTPEILSWWSEFMTLPCVAIGGITPANARPLVDAGADFIAVITAVWNHPEGVTKAIQEFNEVLK